MYQLKTRLVPFLVIFDNVSTLPNPALPTMSCAQTKPTGISFLLVTADPDPVESHRPKSTIFHAIENPYALQEALNRLESSLDEIIGMFQAEKNTLAREGGFSKGKEG